MSNSEGTIIEDKEYSTNEICAKSSWYVCKSHPSVEEYVTKGDHFPNCSKVNCGRTEWHRFIKPWEKNVE